LTKEAIRYFAECPSLPLSQGMLQLVA
jgi:hypothetical protein